MSDTEPTSFTVTWGPPADPNGDILSYHLYVTLDPRDAAYLGSMNLEEKFNINNTSRSYVVSGLHEFTMYSLRLAASTSAGIGNRTEPIEVKTGTAGKFNYCGLSRVLPIVI